MSLWLELRRRRVFQVAAVYAVVAWLLVQIVATVEGPLSLPDWFDTTVIVLLAVGFPITLVISWAFDLTSRGFVSDDGTRTSARVGGRALEYVLMGLLVVVVGFLFIDDYLGNASGGAEDIAIEATAAEAAGEGRDVIPNSVAVLPFASLSPDPGNEYFAAGIHDEILNQLAKLESLNVIARTSVMQYAEAARPITEIAEELNVETIIEGSISYAEDRVAVRAQLIDAETGVHLWSDSYNREFANVFGIQADIARNVANALQAEFSAAEQTRIEQPPTDSPEAYALYLQALAIFGTAQNDPRVRELLREAIAIDPDFALARARLAWLNGQTLINTVFGAAVAPDRRVELEALVRRHAERAIELDPDVEFAHTALADLALFSWHWTEAREAYERALEASPHDWNARGYLGYLLAYLGEHDAAVELVQRGLELNPDTTFPPHYSLAYAGRYEEAAASARRTIRRQRARNQVQPLTHQWLAYTEIANGNYDTALDELRLSERLMGENRIMAALPELAHGYSRIGRDEDAQRLFAEIQAAADDGAPIGAGGWATAYLAIGEDEQALEWLEVVAEKAADHEPDPGFFNVMNVKMNITNSPVLERPEFVEVLRRIRGD